MLAKYAAPADDQFRGGQYATFALSGRRWLLFQPLRGQILASRKPPSEVKGPNTPIPFFSLCVPDINKSTTLHTERF